MPHVVLSAAQDKQEADIVAVAGQPGRITVATNMAGRGTDIKLAAGVAERGGLQVIMVERNDSRRVDGQLAGRGGRQGEPGSFQAILSLDDELSRVYLKGAPGVLARRVVGDGRGFSQALLRKLVRHAQARAEASHAAIRRELLTMDEQLGDLLAFG